MLRVSFFRLCLSAVLCWSATAIAAPAALTLRQATSFSFLSDLVAARAATRIAWVQRIDGKRIVWTATAPTYSPRMVVSYPDDGQELSALAISPDGRLLAWNRGGDPDSNWAADDNRQPNPRSLPQSQEKEIWLATAAGGPSRRVASGDFSVIGHGGSIYFLRSGSIWQIDGTRGAKERRLVQLQGIARDLTLSPDGKRMAFVSDRGDHSFIGIYNGQSAPLTWLAPAAAWDENPVWSPDGAKVAFTRRTATGGDPKPLLDETAQPWSILTANSATGVGSTIWRSPSISEGSYPDVPGGIHLMWGAPDRLTFRAEIDNWPHLYSVPISGGPASLLTPGNFMVERVTATATGDRLFFDANAGALPDDIDRRHIFSTSSAGMPAVALSQGIGSEWSPVAVGSDHVAFIAAMPQGQPTIILKALRGGADRKVFASPANAASATFVIPKMVTFKASDGTVVHGQLFATPNASARRPAVIYVHGGPSRQMLLGWTPMFYYSHAYAMNQYLASQGYVVLSVNYRLGIGYGRAFQHPKNAGPAGASEYQDVLAAAQYLRASPDVDGDRIGIWGGSYGGYLAALALARDSGIFKAGVDLHGVHDWSRNIANEVPADKRYEQGDRAEALARAFASSPVASMSTWKSPVLLIHGDDDRNVRFAQTIDLVNRLELRGIPYEQLVLPDEIHDFLTDDHWRKADDTTVRFLNETLKP